MAGRIRISGGQLRGRFIQTHDSRELRPTTERVRESIFSALESRERLVQATVLDLYAGSGILGIEALSRGASRADFIEVNRKRASMLQESLSYLGCTGRSSVVTAKVEQALKGAKLGTFSLIFADPPYGTVSLVDVLSAVHGARIVDAKWSLIFEASRGDVPRSDAEILEAVPSSEPGSTEIWRRKFGETTVVGIFV